MSLLFLENTLQQYANELMGLQRSDSKRNFFVVPDAENAEAALTAVRNELGWPCLILEYPDSEVVEENATTETLQVNIAVLHFSDQKNSGINNAKTVIYEICAPLVEQVLAKLKKDAKSKTLKYNCAPVHIMQRAQGQWIGPVINGAWGFRYSVDMRIFRDPFRYDATKWV